MGSSKIIAQGQRQGQRQGHVVSAFMWYLLKEKTIKI